MAKISVNHRNKRRKDLVDKLRKKRDHIRDKAKDLSLPLDERMEWQMKLQKLPINSAPCRLRNRCRMTGRPRGVYKKFGLSRTKLRECAMQGLIPGLVKSSW